MTINLDSKPAKTPSSAIVVGVLLNGEDVTKLDDDLDELEALLRTLNVPVKGRIIQRRQKLTAKCLLGSGKVEEIKQLAHAEGAEMVVFDRSLSAPQIRNLESMTRCQVFDRTGVILEIFSRHAHTNQARTQVELARLEYMMPRLAGAWTHFHRQKGGVNMRGMGEKQIEIDRRRARERMARLRTQLDSIQKEKATQRKARSNELKVALVGYTNSGKTTLMKGLTRALAEGKNELFATLDTNIKTIDPKTRPKILLSDTVGFIRNLPHSLVESFRTTLAEVKEADLLIHVVDVSHPCYDEHIKTTHQVLDEIGASQVPEIVVFNKVDQLEDRLLGRVLRKAYKDSMLLSAHKLTDVLELREHIYNFFKDSMVELTVTVPVIDQVTQSLIYNTSLILDTDYTEDGQVIFHIQTTQSMLGKLKQYVAPTAGGFEEDEIIYGNHYAG